MIVLLLLLLIAHK